MKIKTSDLVGAQLDWAILRCEGQFERSPHTGDGASFLRLRKSKYQNRMLFISVDWAQGGPIIDREGISLIRQTADRWVSEYSNGCDRDDHARSWGPTPLTAAMRCFVANKLGDEVEVPDELA